MRARASAIVAFDGQSLNLSPTTVSDRFPAKVEAQLTGTICPVVARSDTTWAERSVDAARRVDRWLLRATGPATLVDTAGTRNVNSAQTAAEILTEAETYWSARLAAGWVRIVVCTVTDSTGFDAAEDTKRADLNDLIRASSIPAAVADIAAVANLADATNATYFGDGTHLTAAGADEIVPVVLAAVP